MKKRKFMTAALCAGVLALGVFAFASPTTSTHLRSAKPAPAQRTTKAQPEQVRREAPVPDHIVYGVLLHHVDALRKQAEKDERRGKDGSGLRSTYKHKADLSDYEAHMLEQIATECEEEVTQQDARAKPILDAFRARYPNGIVPPGETLSPPPPQLTVLQKERDQMVLRARDRLRAAFGPEGFTRFERFIQSEVAPEIQRIKPRHGPFNKRPDKP